MIHPVRLVVPECSTLQRFVPVVVYVGVPFALRAGGGAMKLTLLGENAIRLEPTDGPMNIEALTAELNYSPFHMLAGGLAYCTFSVLYSWASQARLDATGLTIDVSWTFAEDPHRVGSLDIRFNWPALPANRLEAAKRVSEMCTIHATLHHPPSITINGTTDRR
jgi:uncharacterized OsmC-like protein